MEEIERTIAYYNSSNADKTLDKATPLMICGDINREEAGLKALEKLGYPVSVLKPPLKYPESFNPSEYMVNAGLALKGKLPGGSSSQYSLINVDILPEAYKPPTFSWTRVLVPVGVVVALCILAYGVLLVNDIHDEEARIRSEYDMVNASLVRLRAEIKPLQDELAEKKAIAEALPPQAAALEAEIQALTDKIGFYQTLMAALQQGLDNASTDFNAVVTRVAPGLSLTNMSCDGDVITLTGSASGQDLILEYARSLRDSALFREVIVTSIQQVEPEEGTAAAVVYQFRIDLK
jgi:Tfp pilus assembly protein PilN